MNYSDKKLEFSEKVARAYEACTGLFNAAYYGLPAVAAVGVNILGAVLKNPLINVSSITLLAHIPILGNIENLIYKPYKQAPLTKNEKLLLKTVFNDAVDAEKVVKIGTKISNEDWAYLVTPNQIICYGDKNYHEDFVQTDIVTFCDFMHEATHIWQGQNKIKNRKLDNDSYEYSLSDEFNFMDYGTEQQASIMEDYAGEFLHSAVRTSGISSQCQNYDSEKLKNIVEAQFPKVKKLREVIEKHDIENPRQLVKVELI